MIRIGTSGWQYADWRGRVYARKYDEAIATHRLIDPRYAGWTDQTGH